jgi:ribonucleoside-diphosphate reductase alpha chain
MSTGVCNLASFNLPMFVKKENNKFVFDFEKFGDVVYWGIRFLDNVNDVSTTPLPEYDAAVKSKRRIGLGVMGLGSLHFMLGMKYGSAESLQFIEKLYKLKSEKELLASSEIGKEKGSFEAFDSAKYFDSYWWKNLRISDEVKKQIELNGTMRNSHQSMNAPTGNTGIYAKNVSGGIEPIFSQGYSRWSTVIDSIQMELMASGLKYPDVRKQEWFETEHFKFATRGNEQILKGSFNDKNYEIDKNRGLTVENPVYDYGWKFVLENYTPEQIESMTTDGIFATAQNLEVEDHTNVLEIIAHYTNQSNSKTINVPNDYPYDKFKDVYMKAYDAGIKGITTYRDGTMTAVLEVSDKSKEQNPEPFQEHNAPKRPESLKCDIHQVKIKGEAWSIFVGLMDGKPYEILGGKSSFVNISKKIVKGHLVKNSKKVGANKSIYDLHYGDDDAPTIIKDVVRTFENPTEGEFSRMVSLALRHGSPVQYIVEQLQKDEEGDLYSFSKVLSRVLKTYIKTGLKVTGKTCPECGSDKLIYIDGCCSCSKCFWQKCS